jgi:dCMP deaminase
LIKEKFLQAYMDVADRFAKLSHARRLHVGAIVVKDDRIISIGYNGMPAGWDNNCEYEEYTYDERDTVNGDWTYNTVSKKWSKLKTNPEVLHAETNAIAKLARSSDSGLDADIFITHAPCLDCAKLIYQSGIKRVFYRDSYRNTDGVTFLEKSNITVIQIEKEEK